jgi:Family of unknown function (DUF6507)
LGTSGQSWDIDVGGVKGVLARTGMVADDFEAEIGSYSRNLESAAESAGTLTMDGKPPLSGLVGAALAEFAQQAGDDLNFLAARTEKAIQGAFDATSAYLHGDMAMAGATQHKALRFPALSPPDGREPHWRRKPPPQ